MHTHQVICAMDLVHCFNSMLIILFYFNLVGIFLKNIDEKENLFLGFLENKRILRDLFIIVPGIWYSRE